MVYVFMFVIGNKFGEPVVAGFTRSYGQIILSNINDNGKLKTITERREWIKPIMFTAGTGMMDSRHSSKKAPEPVFLQNLINITSLIFNI
jgi:phosphoribosylformylglycinamidine synthase